MAASKNQLAELGRRGDKLKTLLPRENGRRLDEEKIPAGVTSDARLGRPIAMHVFFRNMESTNAASEFAPAASCLFSPSIYELSWKFRSAFACLGGRCRAGRREHEQSHRDKGRQKATTWTRRGPLLELKQANMLPSWERLLLWGA